MIFILLISVLLSLTCEFIDKNMSSRLEKKKKLENRRLVKSQFFDQLWANFNTEKRKEERNRLFNMKIYQNRLMKRVVTEHKLLNETVKICRNPYQQCNYDRKSAIYVLSFMATKMPPQMRSFASARGQVHLK